MRPMSERRVQWREHAPKGNCGYDWLRAELRDLERRSRSSRVFRCRTRLARARVMRKATAVITAGRIRLDAAMPPGAVIDLDGPRGVRTMRKEARTGWDRMHAAQAWFLSSAAHAADPSLCGQVAAETSARLAELAEAIATAADGRGWLR